MASSKRSDRTTREMRVLLAIAVLVCLVAGVTVFVFVHHRTEGRSWDEDVTGPVFVSRDGRTLSLPSGPSSANPGDSCFTETADVVAEQHPRTVALRFHIREVNQNGFAGTCAEYGVYSFALDRPLGSRTLTDSHGRPLSTFDERAAPWLRDPRLTEPAPPVPCPRPVLGRPVCDGALVVEHTYTGQGRSWVLTEGEAVASAPVDPKAVPTPIPTPLPTSIWTSTSTSTWELPFTVNHTAAECRNGGPGPYSPVLQWREGRYALALALVPTAAPSDDNATCFALGQEAGFVR